MLAFMLTGSRVMSDDKLRPDVCPSVFRQGTSGGNYVALSFDDSPMPRTGDLLRILDELDVRATFFVCGNYATWRPELLEAIAAAGHEIGNHTYDHPNLTRVDDEALRDELARTNRIVKAVTGVVPHLFRPPGGNYDSRVVEEAYRQEMTTVMWSVSCSDYRNPPVSQLTSCVVRNVRPGAVVLLHDGKRSTLAALPEIVRELREEGYVFVTVGELMRLTSGISLWPGSQDEQTSEEERGVF
jgi:peptidoglycan/xylan/chitin deacetylase (PgdA/CDA1 family)